MSKFNPTISHTETKLFNELKNLGLRPKAQFEEKIAGSTKSYYIDIAFPDEKIAIEVDGMHHLNTKDKDTVKDANLEAYGWKVHRFPADEVFQNTEEYARKIKEIVEYVKPKSERDIQRELKEKGWVKKIQKEEAERVQNEEAEKVKFERKNKNPLYRYRNKIYVILLIFISILIYSFTPKEVSFHFIIMLISIFWVIYDIYENQKNMSNIKKTIWIILVIFFNVITVIVYFFKVKKRYI